MRPAFDRHQRLRAVFDEALLLDPTARAAYVNQGHHVSQVSRSAD